MATKTKPGIEPDRISLLETLDRRLRWLSTWTIHNASIVRESRDNLKVGGHQASCASISSINPWFLNVLRSVARGQTFFAIVSNGPPCLWPTAPSSKSPNES